MSWRNVLLGIAIGGAINAVAFLAHVYTFDTQDNIEIRDYLEPSLTWLADKMPPIGVILASCVGCVLFAFWDKGMKMVDWSNLWKKPGLPGSRVGEGKTERVREAINQSWGCASRDDASSGKPIKSPTVGDEVCLKKQFHCHATGTRGMVTRIDSELGRVTMYYVTFSWPVSHQFHSDHFDEWLLLVGVPAFDSEHFESIYFNAKPPVSSGKPASPVCKELDEPASVRDIPVGARVRLSRACYGHPVGKFGSVAGFDGEYVGVRFDGCDTAEQFHPLAPALYWFEVIGEPVETPARSAVFPIGCKVQLKKDAASDLRAGMVGEIIEAYSDGGVRVRFGDNDTFLFMKPAEWLEFAPEMAAMPLVNATVLHEAKEGMRVRYSNGRMATIRRRGGQGLVVDEDGDDGKIIVGAIDNGLLPDWLEEVQEPATTASDFDPATAGDYGDIVCSGGALSSPTITYVDVEKESLRAEVARLKEQLEAEYKRWNGVCNALGDYRLLAEEPADAIRRLKTEFLHVIEDRGDVKALREEVARLKASEGELVVTLRQNIIHWQAKCREAEDRCRTLEAITSVPKSPVGRIEEHLWKMLNEDNLLDQHKIDVMDRLMEIERMKMEVIHA